LIYAPNPRQRLNATYAHTTIVLPDPRGPRLKRPVDRKHRAWRNYQSFGSNPGRFLISISSSPTANNRKPYFLRVGEHVLFYTEAGGDPYTKGRV